MLAMPLSRRNGPTMLENPRGTLVNATQSLIDAIRAGDADAAVAVLEQTPEAAHGVGAAGESPILEALYRGQQQVAARIAQERDITLAEAAALGAESRLNALLERADHALDQRSADGWTPLHLAAFFGHTGTVAALIARGADLEALSANRMANTPLCAAIAGACNRTTIAALLDSGANANAEGGGGVRPVHLAASRGAAPVLRELLVRGARADVATDEGKTAAQYATERGHPGVASLLEAAGGNASGG